MAAGKKNENGGGGEKNEKKGKKGNGKRRKTAYKRIFKGLKLKNSHMKIVRETKCGTVGGWGWGDDRNV